MKEYELRRSVFYKLNGHLSFEDEHKNFPIVFDESTVVEDAVTYLVDGTSYLRFPGAPRAVAIAVADFIARNFGEDFYEVLTNSELMHGNDPYFRTYPEDKETYDKILKVIPREKINWDSHRMSITRRLITQEYMLDDEGLILLERN